MTSVVDTFLTIVTASATTVVTMGVLHVVRAVGNPLRLRRQPAPLDMSQYRVRE